jgi:Trypsin
MTLINLRNFLLLLVLGHSSFACAILNGSPGNRDSTVEKGTVALVVEDTRTQGPNGEHGYYPTSGVLISQNWVLTVKHGMAKHLSEQYDWQVHFSPEIKSKPKTGVLKVLRTNVIFHPALDLALVYIGNSAPVEYRPVQVLQNWPDAMQSEPTRITLAGYGPAADAVGTNRLNFVEEPISAISMVNSDRNPGLFPPDQAGYYMEMDQKDGKGSCKGDSGGPALLKLSDGSLALLGVIAGNVSYQGGHPCLQYSYVIRIDRVINWITASTGLFYNSAAMRFQKLN